MASLDLKSTCISGGSRAGGVSIIIGSDQGPWDDPRCSRTRRRYTESGWRSLTVARPSRVFVWTILKSRSPTASKPCSKRV